MPRDTATVADLIDVVLQEASLLKLNREDHDVAYAIVGDLKEAVDRLRDKLEEEEE